MRKSLVSRLDRHFTAATALAATVGGGAGVAQAAIVYSGVISINIPSTTAGVYLNVVTGVNDPVPGNVPGWDVNPWSSTALSMYSPTPNPGGPYVGPGATTTYNNLAVGAVVGPASTYTTSTGVSTINAATPLNFNSNNNYVGFRFINEANGNAVHYGWMRISLSATAAGQPRAIVEYAYEDQAGVEIAVGATGGGGCYANCDSSTAVPVLNVADFTCFLTKFASGNPGNIADPANCDGSTTLPVLNVADFTCFLTKFAGGCP